MRRVSGWCASSRVGSDFRVRHAWHLTSDRAQRKARNSSTVLLPLPRRGRRLTRASVKDWENLWLKQETQLLVRQINEVGELVPGTFSAVR